MSAGAPAHDVGTADAQGYRGTIRSMLIRAAILAVIPPWICIAAGILMLYERERDDIGHNTISIATALMAAVDRDLAGTTAALEVLANSQMLEAGDFAAFHQRASALVPKLGNNIVLTDPSGRQIVNTLLPYGEALPPRAGSPHQGKVLASGKPAISDVFIGSVTGRPVIAITVPVFRGDVVAYTLAAGVFPERLRALLVQPGLQADWITAIFDAAGVIAARSHEPERYVGQKASPGLMAAMPRATAGVTEISTLEGIPVIAAYSRSALSGWTVAIGIPSAPLYGELRRDFSLGAGAALVLLGLSLALAGRQSRRIAGAVRALIAPALALGRGEVPSVPRLQVREVDEVAQAIRRAAHLLQSRTAERDGADAALRASEHKLSVLVDHALDGLIAIDEQGRIEHFNPACERIFGYAADEVMGRNVKMLMPESYHRQHDDYLSSYLTIGNPKIIGTAGREVVGRRKDGAEFPMDFSINVFRSGDKRHISGLLRDISERKQAQVKLLRYTNALRRNNREMEEFAYAASHDLKAPLRVIDNASKWLQEDLAPHLTEETREHMTLMRGRIARMEKLLDDLLDYSRVGKATDRRGGGEIVAGDVLMADILALLSPPPGFMVKVCPGFAAIRVSTMPLQQILMNLLGNAIKHHHRNEGCIEVSVEDCEADYFFVVKDDGPGIALRFQDQIFKMFQTLKPRDQVEGSGMGLALVRKAIEVYGGTISLQSAEGQGSTFRFSWPKRQRPEGEYE